MTKDDALRLALEALQGAADFIPPEDEHNCKCQLCMAQDAIREALELPQQEPVAWRPIDSVPKGRIVLVHYKNALGNGRIMRARYYLPETLESDDTESGWADAGWYEESEAYEYLMPLEHEPTHWMPLPPDPYTTPPRREALEQPQQEPVAWPYWHSNGDGTESEDVYIGRSFPAYKRPLRPPVPLYTAPQRREWVGLTDEDWLSLGCKSPEEVRFALAIQAALKERNA